MKDELKILQQTDVQPIIFYNLKEKGNGSDNW